MECLDLSPRNMPSASGYMMGKNITDKVLVSMEEWELGASGGSSLNRDQLDRLSCEYAWFLRYPMSNSLRHRSIAWATTEKHLNNVDYGQIPLATPLSLWKSTRVFDRECKFRNNSATTVYSVCVCVLSIILRLGILGAIVVGIVFTIIAEEQPNMIWLVSVIGAVGGIMLVVFKYSAASSNAKAVNNIVTKLATTQRRMTESELLVAGSLVKALDTKLGKSSKQGFGKQDQNASLILEQLCGWIFYCTGVHISAGFRIIADNKCIRYVAPELVHTDLATLLLQRGESFRVQCSTCGQCFAIVVIVAALSLAILMLRYFWEGAVAVNN